MAGLYIHIPFCRKKCNYCDFCSFVKDEDTIFAYLEALKREIDFTCGCFVPDTIYFGGGTPSLLSLKDLKFLFGLVINNFKLNDVQETTLESNPESITEEKLKLIKDSGITRLSIGLQCLDNNLLNFLGRIHTVEEFFKKYELARKVGFNNINVDLIYGIPGQTLEDWENTLGNLVQLKPEHISAYCLSVEDRTNFKKDGVSVDEDTSADMYEFAVEYLVKSGYVHYEISNFAQPGQECKHNINYWQNGQYLGLGCSAVSYIEGIRKKNTSDLNIYIKTAGISLEIEEMEENKNDITLGEKVFLGLRMIEGIVLTEDIIDRYGTAIDRFIDDGLLKMKSGRVALTKKGLFVSNRIFMEFV